MENKPSLQTSRQWFGTDGMRGTIGVSPMTPDIILKVAHAAGRYFAAQAVAAGDTAKPTVVIGKDTRISGYMLEALLEAGFTSAGVDVLLVGPMPTPAIAQMTRALRLTAGVVISASHNPYHDNGIKFFAAGGKKLPDAAELEIEQLAQAGIQCVPSKQLGKARRVNDAEGRYIEFCKSTMPQDFNLKGMNLVVDCAHGAAYKVAKPILHELGANVHLMGHAPNGININDEVGATHPKALRAAVLEHAADYGIALDGDADRLVMIDHTGRSYDGDELLFAVVKHAHSVKPVAGVVGTLMTNMAFEKAMAAMGIPFFRAAVGDRYILEQLHARGWLFGGENSGHILTLGCHTTGDGMVSALHVLQAIKSSGQTLADYIAEMKLYPQILINVRLNAGSNAKAILVSAEVIAAQKSAEVALGDTGRVLLRASGTEPLLRVMVEAQNRVTAQTQAEMIADIVKKY